ncbi:MAG: alanine racemase, partial [Armatimonadetes bacterium]|nr:alanine racemase [Armatimonadota bacterium]
MTLHDLDTPCAVVELSALQRNIGAMAQLASGHGKALRPHLKTHKCIEIARMQKDAGAHGVTVAKLGEAEVFAKAGFDDILVANLIVGEAKLDRLRALASLLRIAVGVDSVAVLDGLARASRGVACPIGIAIEVDTGHHRTGVRTIADAARLAERIRSTPALELRGVYTHEGHVYKAEPAAIPDVCEAVVAAIIRVAEAVGTDVVSVGSTPSVEAMATHPSVTELRPGNYVLRDATQMRLGAPMAACALSVIATVIAVPSRTDAFVDAGSKALSGDRDPVYGHGRLRDAP